MTHTFQEYRCRTNWYLLCKAYGTWQVEIVNPSNRVMNYTWPSRKSQQEWPTGVDFQQYALDMRCQNCRRLLWKAVWTDLVCEIKCSHCKYTTLFEMEKMQESRFYYLSSTRRKQLEDQILLSIGVVSLDNK